MKGDSILERLNGKIALITGYLIFIGFIYEHSYFSMFGISIRHYLSTTEMILSFLDLSIPLLVLVTFVTIIFTLSNTIDIFFNTESSVKRPSDEVQNAGESNKPSKEATHTIPKLFRELKTNLKGGWTNWINILKVGLLLVFFLAFFLFRLCFPIYFLLGIAGYISGDYFNFSTLFFLSATWLVHLEADDLQIIPSLKKTEHTILIFSLFLIGMAWQYNQEKAAIILDNCDCTHGFELEYMGETITSGADLLYLGNTQSHLFLYDRRDSTSIIYKMSELSKFSFKVH